MSVRCFVCEVNRLISKVVVVLWSWWWQGWHCHLGKHITTLQQIVISEINTEKKMVSSSSLFKSFLFYVDVHTCVHEVRTALGSQFSLSPMGGTLVSCFTASAFTWCCSPRPLLLYLDRKSTEWCLPTCLETFLWKAEYDGVDLWSQHLGQQNPEFKARSPFLSSGLGSGP